MRDVLSIKVLRLVLISFKDNSMPTIKENVIVGAGAKIIGGVVIGKGVIVGANAVVTKDVPEFSIVVGEPVNNSV